MRNSSSRRNKIQNKTRESDGNSVRCAFLSLSHQCRSNRRLNDDATLICIRCTLRRLHRVYSAGYKRGQRFRWDYIDRASAARFIRIYSRSCLCVEGTTADARGPSHPRRGTFLIAASRVFFVASWDWRRCWWPMNFHWCCYRFGWIWGFVGWRNSVGLIVEKQYLCHFFV